MNHSLRKVFFNFIKRYPMTPDASLFLSIFMFNIALISYFGLWNELVPTHFMFLGFLILFTGRRMNTEQILSDLLKEGDVVSFTMRGGNIHMGFIVNAIPENEINRLGIQPGRQYVALVDQDGENRVMPLTNVLAME